jgi:hypothetical protein
VNPTSDEIGAQISKMKSWSKLVSAYEDALSGKSPLKAVTKRAASPEMRKRNQSFNKRTWIRLKTQKHNGNPH